MTLGEAIEELIRQYDKACAQSDEFPSPITRALKGTFIASLNYDTMKELDNMHELEKDSC